MERDTVDRRPARNPARSDAIVGRTPMARWGTPDDVLAAVLFLAGAGVGFITGALLNFDGGYAAM
jgi:2-dehydro-3-deoxy-D-gluconate 5-dehydrogenase